MYSTIVINNKSQSFLLFPIIIYTTSTYFFFFFDYSKTMAFIKIKLIINKKYSIFKKAKEKSIKYYFALIYITKLFLDINLFNVFNKKILTF